MPTPLGDRLRELRERVGELKQAELAEVLDVSAALVSGWENGKAQPPRRRLQAYAERFGGDQEDQLLQELLDLRLESVTLDRQRVGMPRDAGQQTTMLDVLQDIRWLLVEIRDRLPPP